MHKPTVKEIITKAFYLGAGGSQATGEWASLFQLGPIKSFAYFQDGRMIYEAAIHAETLEITPMDPPLFFKAQVIHEALGRLIADVKEARADKWYCK